MYVFVYMSVHVNTKLQIDGYAQTVLYDLQTQIICFSDLIE